MIMEWEWKATTTMGSSVVYGFCLGLYLLSASQEPHTPKVRVLQHPRLEGTQFVRPAASGDPLYAVLCEADTGNLLHTVMVSAHPPSPDTQAEVRAAQNLFMLRVPTGFGPEGAILWTDVSPETLRSAAATNPVWQRHNIESCLAHLHTH